MSEPTDTSATSATETPDAGAAPTAMAEYVPMAHASRPDDERFPALDDAGRERLAALRAHAHAPAWTHACGDLLTADDHAVLGSWADGLPGRAVAHAAAPPPWLRDEVERLAPVVPHLRRLGVRGWDDVPTVRRADLAAAVADFVPVDVPLDRVVQGTSSGTTGSSLVIPWHPVDIAKDLALLAHLLDGIGVPWHHDPDRMGLLSVVDQEMAFTYASAMTLRAGQSMARVTLREAAWPSPAARGAFLADADPQVVSGSALSLLAYARAVARVEPRPVPLALVSGAVHLSAPARAHLESHVGAPVLDLYGLREVGPVACETAAGAGHVLVPRRMFVEVLDPDGEPVPDGVTGEVTVSSLENPYLPLLRYRTGDRAALVGEGAARRLVGLEGRAAVVFAAADGRLVQSVELTQQLQRHGVLAWAVHQDASGAVTARCLGGSAGDLRASLAALLDQPVAVEQVGAPDDLGPGKPRRFSSDATA